MAKLPNIVYPALVFALFLLSTVVIFMAPPVRLALVDQNKDLIVVGTASFTTGDLIVLIALLGSCVDIASVLLYLKLRKT